MRAPWLFALPLCLLRKKLETIGHLKSLFVVLGASGLVSLH